MIEIGISEYLYVTVHQRWLFSNPVTYTYRFCCYIACTFMYIWPTYLYGFTSPITNESLRHDILYLIVGIEMEKMATEIFCASIHTLKLALAEKNQLKCIDNTIITL